MDLALSCLAFCPFVSICNVWGQKPVYLLQIETNAWVPLVCLNL